ncbi:SDR family oxidoreductase [Apibacter sp. HY039]|uniref:SDR family oxidoreductase n=1 Tax=Apibacter sp. HY039 TaxID=2501476 RepID=UPI000FEC1985|nr:SDR family oxidoreductase [Apibacter sp. HY039]
MILVTGGTGLLGSYILLQLAKINNSRIRVLVRAEASKNEILELFKLYEPESYNCLFNKIEWTEGDVLNLSSVEKALQGVSQVYHIAGKVSFNEHDRAELYKVNVEGTKNMVNLSIENNIDKFCFISSIATLDPMLGKTQIDEESEWNFKVHHSSYACSKYGAEMEVWRGSQEGLKVVIVHPGVILGSRNWKRSSGVLYEMVSKKQLLYTSGKTAYVDAWDVAAICIRLMNSPIYNQRYILISENVSYKKVFTLLRNYFNKSKPFKISDFWLGTIALIIRMITLNRVMSKSVVDALTSKTEYSNKKIVNELAYSFIPVEESLKIHAQNFVKYKNNKND